MKFGIFLLLQSPDMRPSQETYDHALEQGVLADQLGFDYIVAAEHHFSSYGFLPYPLLLIPILAERTKQIRFSTAVVVLPLRNPIQLAEEIAMLTSSPKAASRWASARATSNTNSSALE